MDRVQKLLKSACADENFFKTQLKIDKSHKNDNFISKMIRLVSNMQMLN